ncbi:XRE family transcriptional regulator [Staphylococcus pseudintermedius]|uniref:XRE family transcriptional regulator n=1 Tax=Staphylococcus pseudintermedius TaxID=283734 RepID=UPI0007AE8705|nr:XRE family transcriptional regulator [Staphylococcus pseudintermedius]EGQ1695335.1 LexA family transcriptional regulator [Staphylococcus pseudintermedius]EGQ3119934.1 LexA family transcriptional regulator [Staphylococcus pseudintermedius]EGQ3419953.1 LexA family transcriptional regulator [Staphylococcus pseudintermedius]EGQ3446328.1 LexA family transcriptional regulator [Staphylococcus pseudintermedius]EGQ3489670.1 LexA family transcriptional regulator [Staphylococcus pseudintermedius]
MTFGDRIRNLRKQKALTLQQLSDELHEKFPSKDKKNSFTKGKLSNWENNKSEPIAKTVSQLASYFGVSMDYLIGLEDDIVPLENINHYYQVPFYGKVSAGNFETVEIETKDFDIPDVAFNGRMPSECIALQINGDSMNKILANGSYIIVHDYRKSCDHKLNSNDILVLRLGGEYTVKRVRRTETKLHLDPVSYSDEFKTNSYDLDSIDEIEVIGKVIYNYQIFD